MPGRGRFHPADTTEILATLKTELEGLRTKAAAGEAHQANRARPSAATTRVCPALGYPHQATPSTKNSRAVEDRDAVMPGPHLVSSLLKRWTADTLHHRLRQAHLPYHLDEFTFRFNRRNSRARGMLFYRLLQTAVDTDPHPLKDLIGGS